jgi:hypothetical protein
LREVQLDAAAELSGDVILPGGGCSDLEPHGATLKVERLNTKNAWTIHEGLGPSVIGAEFGRDGVEGVKDRVSGDSRGENHVHKNLRPIAAEIADDADVAIGNGHEGAARVAHDSAAKREMLHPAKGIADLNRVADNVLIFEDDVKAADHVADEVLRAKANAEADESGESGDGRNADAKLGQSREYSDGPDNLVSRSIEDTGECAGLLLADLRGTSL